MERVERANRLTWERQARALHDIRADPEHMPVRGGRCEMRVAVGRIRLGEFTERHGADHDPIAFDERQV